MPKTTAACRLRTALQIACVCVLVAIRGGPAQALVPGVCRAPADHPPCGASRENAAIEPDLDPGVSNPVHLATGEKYLREIDLPTPLHSGHPAFIRFYRSRPPQAPDTILGPHWTHQYDTRLEFHPLGALLVEADGRRLAFNAAGAGPDHSAGLLQHLAKPQARSPDTESTPTWRRVEPDGLEQDFDRHGRLLAVRRTGQPPTLISRHPTGPLAGQIHQIRHAGGTLTLQYDTTPGPPLLTALLTPLGTFQYRYDTAAGSSAHTPTRLAEVLRPDGMRRIYHHEPEHQAGHRHAITGITLAGPKGQHWRARTWAWDTQGRVVQARSGESDTHRLRFTYDLPGPQPGLHLTRVHGPHGQTDLTYRAQAGRTLALSASTQACKECPRQSYPVERDRQGRLAAMGPLQISRSSTGAIQQLQLTQSGWPELILDYDAIGQRIAWSSQLTGKTRASYDANQRLRSLHHANGDTLDITRDAAGRPRQLHYAAAGQAPITVALQWHGTHLRRLVHPNEEETRQYDTQGRLSMRSVRRPHPVGTLHYQERFAYDIAGRLLRHDLPEGGALHYRWADGNRVRAITWAPAQGPSQPVIETVAGQAGYRYGNGLHLQTAASGSDIHLLLSQGSHPLWGERRTLDTQGRIQSLHHFRSAAGTPTAHIRQDYAYDLDDRLAGLRETEGDTPSRHTWLAWAEDGRLAGRHTKQIGALSYSRAAALSPIPRDASGLPLSVQGHAPRYQAQRLLSEIRTRQGVQLHYQHNAQGHTIRRQAGAHETERYYLDNRLVAIWHRPEAGHSKDLIRPTFGVTQRYIYAHEVPVGLLQTDAQGSTQLYAIHADLTGRPVLVTDAQRQIRWSATYDAFGKARTQGDLTLPLRAPGQDEDPATGWHDNVFRTYLPERGQYLEPDPLGPVPGQQALGYAAQQPMRHADPLGLILLSFDGTRFDRQNQGNVWKLTQAYDDGPAFYRGGPGNSQSLDWDALTAASSGQILRTQWQSLLGALQRAQGAAQAIPIDLLGFSRGAALARDFANRIARQTRDGWFSYDDPLLGTIGLCVNLRFLGLFDTVAQFGLLGAANAGYDLTLSGAWQWVAHAVALHEFRTLFPLVSATLGGNGHAVEVGFIGAHADIGGGLARNDQGQLAPGGDLSDVALNWMRWQAMAALVPMRPLPAEDQRVTQALLHDERTPAERLLGSDRIVQDTTARSLGPQSATDHIGAAQRQALDAFIQRIGAWQIASGNIVGTVDMRGYDQWLQTELGLPSLAIEN
ncbi:MAG TPA: DUF2235 domain-containing protein [Castellaniella sp.]|uniref:phospholipase effector Tle1 domain-containing protein n=1 Tax=Castellaniella sp. TaxID=1955812 RepID=UPI002F02191E